MTQCLQDHSQIQWFSFSMPRAGPAGSVQKQDKQGADTNHILLSPRNKNLWEFSEGNTLLKINNRINARQSERLHSVCGLGKNFLGYSKLRKLFCRTYTRLKLLPEEHKRYEGMIFSEWREVESWVFLLISCQQSIHVLWLVNKQHLAYPG